MTVKLEWGAPPPEALNPRMGSGFYGQVAKMLRERPHEWAQVPREFSSQESAKSAAANIRLGRMKAMPAGMYEAAAADKKLWVRYVGDDEGTPPDEDEDNKDEKNVVRMPRNQDAAKIRAWAAGQGIEIGDRGRLPADLIAKYEAAERAAQES